MGLPNLLLGFFKMEVVPAGTEKSLAACNVSEAHVQAELDAANSKLGTANSALGACTQDTTAQQQAIAQQAVTIQQQTDKITELNAKVTNARRELWLKPCPALLQEVPKEKVMLGQLYMKTAQGSFFLDYPTHPSIYSPSPIYEATLTASDCNRVRADIGGQEIAIKIANYEQQHMTYMPDIQQYTVSDCWMEAKIAKLLGKDDCETLATNINNALFYHQQKWGAFPNHSVFLGLGHLKQGSASYGHGFVVLMHDTSTDLKDSFLIEATLAYQATPMPLSEAKTFYDMDWGLIGWPRDAHPEGTYQFSPSYSWWSSSTRVVGAEREGRLQEFIHRLKLEPTKNERKREAIKRIWESRSRR